MSVHSVPVKPLAHADALAGSHECSLEVVGEALDAPASLVALLSLRAERLGDRTLYTFLADGEIEAERLSFRGLHDAACALAVALRERMEPAANVLLAYPPGLDFIVAFFGCLYAGVVPVPVQPVHPRRGNERLAAIAADCGARVLLTIDALIRCAREARELAGLALFATDRCGGSTPSFPFPTLRPNGEGSLVCPPETLIFPSRSGVGDERTLPSPSGRGVGGGEKCNLALLQYTSGSTASPRGVKVTHGNVLANLAAIHAAEANDADSRGVSWLPCYHDMGLIEGILQPLYGGYPTWLMAHAAFLQRPVRWLRAISRYRASVSGGPNFAFDACVRRIGDAELAGLDLGSWRVAYCGAEPVRADTLDRFAARFQPCGFRPQALRPVYGLAEATLLVAASDGAAPRPRVRHAHRPSLESGRFVAANDGIALVSCGKPQLGTAIAIVDPASGNPLAEGSIGEIWVSGPGVAPGYWSQTPTAEVFRTAAIGGPARAWLCTGDLGMLLGGELYVSGRRKDLIILRGRKLHPQDIEHTVQSVQAPRLDAVAAFALPKHEGDAVIVLAELQPAQPSEGPHLYAALADAIRTEVYRCHDIGIDALGFVRRGALARTSSGKLARFRCRADFINSRLSLIARFDIPASEPSWGSV